MKRAISLVLVVVIGILSVVGCGQKAPTWQEQYDLGVRYLSEGNYEEAIIAFTAAIEIDPKQAPAYVGRGQAYLLSEETWENILAAVRDFESAVEIDEKLFDAWKYLADTYIKLGESEKTLDILGKIEQFQDETLNLSGIKSELVNGSGYGLGEGNTLENIVNRGHTVNYSGKTYLLLGNNLYVEKENGQEKADLGPTDYYLQAPIFVSGNWLYAEGFYKGSSSSSSNGIIRYNFLTQEWQTLGEFEDVNDYILGLWDKYIFFTDSQSKSPYHDIYRMELDGSNSTCITTFQQAEPLFIINGWIYYEDNASIEDGIAFPHIDNLNLYSESRFMWGQIYRMDINGDSIQQITDKELEESLGNIYAQDYNSDIGYEFAYMYNNKLYCGTGANGLWQGDELLYFVSLLFCYDLSDGSCHVVDDMVKNDRVAYSNSTVSIGPWILVKDNFMWLLLRIDDTYHETIMLNMETEKLVPPDDNQLKAGYLLASGWGNRCITDKNFYQLVEWSGEKSKWEKLNLITGKSEVLFFEQ